LNGRRNNDTDEQPQLRINYIIDSEEGWGCKTYGSTLFVSKIKMSADMSDSVKQKRPIQCPLFYRGLFYFIYKTVEIYSFCYIC